MQKALTVTETWLDKLGSTSTKKFYKLCLEKFCAYTEKTPEQLAKLTAKQATPLIESYISYLKSIAVERSGKPVEGQISFNSVGYYVAGLKSFFDLLPTNLVINWKRINKALPRKDKKKKSKFRSYDVHEIRKMLSLADRREKVIILLMVSAGVRVGAIPELQFRHISRTYSCVNSKGEREVREFPDGIASIEVYDGAYRSFITAECVAAIEDYKRYRVEQLHETIKPDSFIVRDAYHIRPILVGTVRKTIWELFTKTGLPTEELQPDHGFRHYFKTVCENSGVKHNWSEAFEGHSQGLRDVYFDPNREDSWTRAIENYQLAVGGLTITEAARQTLSNEIKLKNVPELEKLQKENEGLQSQVKDLESRALSPENIKQLDEIEAMWEKIRRMEAEKEADKKYWKDASPELERALQSPGFKAALEKIEKEKGKQ